MADNGSPLDRVEKTLANLAGGIDHLLEVTANLVTQSERHNRAFELAHAEQNSFRADLRELARYHVLLAEQSRRLDEALGRRIDELAQAHKRTEEKLAEAADKLNALVGVVDDWRQGAASST